MRPCIDRLFHRPRPKPTLRDVHLTGDFLGLMAASGASQSNSQSEPGQRPCRLDGSSFLDGAVWP
jgi:hypothetical protein